MWRIHLIGMPLFAVACTKMVMFLFDRDLNLAAVAVGSVLCSFVLAFTTACLIALWLWPDLLRRAEPRDDMEKPALANAPLPR